MPAFSGTLLFPSPVVLTSPDPASTATKDVDRTRGLAVTWQPTDETVTLGVQVIGAGGATWDQLQGWCDFTGRTTLL